MSSTSDFPYGECLSDPEAARTRDTENHRAADDRQHNQRYPCPPEHSSERHPLAPSRTPVALRYVSDQWDE